MRTRKPRGGGPESASSRWSGLVLNVHRMANGHATVTLVHRRVDGTRTWDRRLGWCDILVEPGSAASQDPLVALKVATQALLVRRATAGADAAPPTPPEGPASPGGLQGELLDSQGRIKIETPTPLSKSASEASSADR